MENITNSSNQFEINFHLIVMVPGLLNITVLLILSCQMYFAIEVAHPIYTILFINLLITTLSFVLDVFVFPFMTGFKYNTLVIWNNTISWLFQCCCWYILSVLRYMYLVHSEWVHNKFQNQRLLSAAAILAVLLTFSLCCFAVLGTAIYFGWPQVRLPEMLPRPRLVCISVMLINYIGLLGLSCFFYFLILRKRGIAGVNSVGVLQKIIIGLCSLTMKVLQFKLNLECS